MDGAVTRTTTATWWWTAPVAALPPWTPSSRTRQAHAPSFPLPGLLAECERWTGTGWQVLAVAAAQGATVVAVLTTHSHWDHAGGNAAFKHLVCV